MPDTDKTRFNTNIASATSTILDERAAAWGVTKGEALDRLVQQAVAVESAEQVAAQGLPALEGMLRRLLADHTVQTAQMLKELLMPQMVNTSTTRLLLFALISHMKGEDVAVANEDRALTYARAGQAKGTIPLLRKGKVDHQ